MPNFFLLKIICWNCRGASSSDVTNTTIDMVRTHNAFMVFLLETRVLATRIEILKRELKFDSTYGIDARGLSGAIWLLWDSQKIQVEILPHDFQALHAIVQVISDPKTKNLSWLISGSYASPDLDNRMVLWDEWKLISDNFSGPWALIGDFNDVFAQHEKSGGRRVNSHRLAAYRDMVDHCSVIDMGFSLQEIAYLVTNDFVTISYYFVTIAKS